MVYQGKTVIQLKLSIMKRNYFIYFFALVLWAISFGELHAQSKKKLREENDLLTSQVQALQRQTQTLAVENRNLKERSALLQNAVDRLRQDSAAMSMEYKLLREDYQELEAKSTTATTSTTATGFTAASTAVDPNDSRPCARKQAQLTAGYSYFPETLSRLNSNGWGVQVYSFSNLCQAVEKAEEFSEYYRMFKTYIRVKEVNGQRVFSVVYGSLRDEAQARTYCENFRKIAKDTEGQNAFIVQH